MSPEAKRWANRTMMKIGANIGTVTLTKETADHFRELMQQAAAFSVLAQSIMRNDRAAQLEILRLHGYTQETNSDLPANHPAQ